MAEDILKSTQIMMDMVSIGTEQKANNAGGMEFIEFIFMTRANESQSRMKLH